MRQVFHSKIIKKTVFFVSSVLALNSYGYVNQFVAAPAPSYEQTPAGVFDGAMMQTEEIRNEEMQEQAAEEQYTQQNVINNNFVFLISQNKKPVLLGCLSCSANSKVATNNPNSVFGSPNGKYSIYNRHNEYGSLTSSYSACNPHAQHPPLIITGAGIKLGYLTLNSTIYGAIKNPILLERLRKNVCGL